MEINKDLVPTKLLWIDLEMTGLDPDNDTIIEIACEVTDFKFKTLSSYEAVVSQPAGKLAKMNQWSKIQHKSSGLLERVKKEGRSEKKVVHELVGFIKAQFGNEPAVLAGNSIHNDRAFIKKHWLEVENLLHYRMLDVTSFKIIAQAKYRIKFAKKDAHRAFDDIQASIAELQFYLEAFRQKP